MRPPSTPHKVSRRLGNLREVLAEDQRERDANAQCTILGHVAGTGEAGLPVNKGSMLCVFLQLA